MFSRSLASVPVHGARLGSHQLLSPHMPLEPPPKSTSEALIVRNGPPDRTQAALMAPIGLTWPPSLKLKIAICLSSPEHSSKLCKVAATDVVLQMDEG